MIICFPKTESPITPKPPLFIFGKRFWGNEVKQQSVPNMEVLQGEESELCVFADNEIEIHVAAYMAEVFQADVDMDSCVTVGEFLHSKMAYTKYRSIRGAQRNVALFHENLKNTI